MSDLLPRNSTALERAIASACANDLPVPIRDLWDVDSCPDNLIPWLGWALHVDGWDEAATIEQKRNAIRDAVLLHRKKGTPWALKLALSKLGIEIDIFDQHEQRRIYAELNPSRVNGLWRLNGAVKIKPLELQALMPQIQRWAQFIVRVNLGSITRGNLFDRLDTLVDEWKPVRSHQIYIFWLSFFFYVTASIFTRALIKKHISARYPWCGRVISDLNGASWRIGIDGEPATLPAAFNSFSVGRLYGKKSNWKISSCRNTAKTYASSRSVAQVWPRETLPPDPVTIYPAAKKLFRRVKALNGSWKIGTQKKLLGQPIFEIGTLSSNKMFLSNRLGRFSLVDPLNPILDQPKPRLTLSGGWQLGGMLTPQFKTKSIRIAHV